MDNSSNSGIKSEIQSNSLHSPAKGMISSVPTGLGKIANILGSIAFVRDHSKRRKNTRIMIVFSIVIKIVDKCMQCKDRLKALEVYEIKNPYEIKYKSTYEIISSVIYDTFYMRRS